MTMTNAQLANQELIDDRHDVLSEINGTLYRISYLWMVQKIIYTGLDGQRAGTIDVERPFASKTPHEMLLRNEVVNHLDHQDSDTRKDQWPEVY